MNILLIEVVVLVTIGWATTLLVMKRKWLRQRQAWQWWHEQQALQSHHKAESIRDDLLQQTFAFRRYLETTAKPTAASTLAARPEAEQSSRWLERFQTFYQSLESLSNDLSPPFVADSFPLALQFALKSWQQDHQQPLFQGKLPADLNLQLSLPSDWPQGSPQQNQIILSIVTGLLSLLIPKASPAQHLQVTLSSEDTRHTLILQLDNDEAQTISKFSEIAEIQHLKEIFHSLTAGQLEINQNDTSLTAHLCWRDQPSHNQPSGDN